MSCQDSSPGQSRSGGVRTCIVTKDQRGYGLTVHGTRPVIVQSVRAEGAAWKAGIRELDEILEVNGFSVAGMSHGEVVKLIKERPCVEFKVTAGTGRKHNGATARQRTTVSTRRTTVTQSGADRRSVDPEQFREISTIPAEAAKHYKSSEKSPQEGDAAPPSGRAQPGLRASVTSPRPWVAVSQTVSPVLQEPSGDATEFPLTHSKSSSMPEASNSLSAPKPSRSKSDSQKRRPVSMDVSHIEVGATATSLGGSPSPSNSNSNLNSKHSKWMSQPRVDDLSAEEHVTAPAASIAIVQPAVTIEESEGSGHRRTNSNEIFEGHSLPSEPTSFGTLSIDDEEMMDDDDEHDQVRRQNELFTELSGVLERPDLTATLVQFGHKKATTQESITDFHRFLCLIVMLDYRRCCSQKDNRDFIKDHRRIAYEIYSSFFAEDSPLDVKLSPGVASDVGEPLRREEEETMASMKSLLLKAEDETARELTLLKKYHIEASRGLDTLHTENFNFLGSLPENRLKYFERKMNGVMNEISQMTESPRRSALLAAVLTINKHFQCSDDKAAYRSMESLASASVMPFNSKMSKSRSMIPNFNKKRTTYNHHSLALKNIETYHQCDECAKVISGTAPQAEVCHNCSSIVHRECRDKWQRHCDRSKRTSLFGTFSSKSDRKMKEISSSTIPETKKRGASREGSAELPSATSPGAEFRNVQNLTKTFETAATNEEDYDFRGSISAHGDSEPSLSRAESMKSTGRSWSHTPSWRNKSDSSQHADTIREAENSIASSDNSMGAPERSTSASIDSERMSNEKQEMEVKMRFESDPLLRGLPGDVEAYFQEFGYRDYYERLSREGSRKGKSHLKDYQSACCEIYFQELSHIRNLKIMKYLFVDAWPESAFDLKAAMGLDKLQELIDQRVQLVELLSRTKTAEDGKKFVNMGQGYLDWLDPERTATLKRLLGSIRYKGENHFDRLLQERYKRVGPVVERTYNKLTLFDLMISVNQHACRPSLLMAPVKKALMKLVKSGEKHYEAELTVWKKAEEHLTEVAHYLDQLKRRVVDVLPKIDASKAREVYDGNEGELANSKVPGYKDIPRCLNTFLFLRDADCLVRKEHDGKARDTRLLLFDDFLVLLYHDNKEGPERFVMRPWEQIMPVIPFDRILHIAIDKTEKSLQTLLLAIFINRETVSTGSGTSSSNKLTTKMIYMTFKDTKLTEMTKGVIMARVDTTANRSKLASARGPSLGSTASMSMMEARKRPQRHDSNVSTMSAMPAFCRDSHDADNVSLSESAATSSSDKDSSPDGLDRQDSSETCKTLRKESSGSCQSLNKDAEVTGRTERLLATLSGVRRAVMTRQGMSEDQFVKMADLVGTEGAKDTNDLHLVLLSHMCSLAQELGKLCAPEADDTPATVSMQASMLQLMEASQGFHDFLQRSMQSCDPRHSNVFVGEETMTESQATTSLASAPKSPSDDEIEEEEEEEEEEVLDRAEEREEEEEELQIEREENEMKEEKEEDEEEDKDTVEDSETPVASADEDLSQSEEEEEDSALTSAARDFVQCVMAGALERCQCEASAHAPPPSTD